MNNNVTIPEFEEARKYVAEHEAELRRTYGHKVIAIYDNKVIDSDVDKFVLASRVIDSRNDERAIRIGTIDDILNPQRVELPSPEIVKQ